MADTIFILQSNGDLLELTPKLDTSESILQSLLARYPNLLAGGQIDPTDPRRWLLIRREMGIPVEEGGGNWLSVDHLFLDQDGIPTFVEVKRSSDTRLRREVVGQMLDYASNAVKHWPDYTIRDRFENACREQELDIEATLMEILDEETDIETYWQQVESNLRTGKIRMLFVADVIPPELQRVVEFLNEQMTQSEVLAIEIKKYAGAGLQTLVPRVIGQTSEAQRSKTGRASKKWDEEFFLEELREKHGERAVYAAQRILEWVKPKVTRIYWGKGSVDGSFVPLLFHNDVKHQLFAVYTYGRLEIYFQWYQYKPPFEDIEKRREFLERINQIPGVTFSDDVLDRRPRILLTDLADEAALDAFFAAFSWFLEQVQET